VKTPSFIEIKTLVEFLNEQIEGSQLQEIHCTDDGLVMTLYRFTLEPRLAYLVFDLDKPYPFMGLFEAHPWPRQKKSKPLGLFLSAHAKNLNVKKIELLENLGRVVRITLGPDEHRCEIEFRLIPKQTNLIVRAADKKKKSISWYPVTELGVNDSTYLTKVDEETRSIPFMMKQWLMRRSSFAVSAGNQAAVSPYEKWKKQRERDLQKKSNALSAIKLQIDKFRSEPWSEVGEHLKSEGFKNLKPEWSEYVKFDQSVSKNMQNCFDKAKSAKTKINGAYKRLQIIQDEINNLQDLSENQFEKHLKKLSDRKNQTPARVVEGRYRKLTLNESNLTCYMGKSAKDNIDLLRKAKSWDYWIHLKDYSSAYAIIHRQKEQSVSEQDLIKCAQWLIKEGRNEKKTQIGGRFSVVVAECRYVRPLKGDKLGRVTYHDAREILIAL
jgi:hypothetical protein